MVSLRDLEITNFRGVRSARVSFSNLNFIVGSNGSGKTTCLAAIARLLPILRFEKRIFLDGDFLFDGETARDIELKYSFDLTDANGNSDSYVVTARGVRQQQGVMRSHLNDQIVGAIEITFQSGIDQAALRNRLAQEASTQRIIRSGWGGGRICPISLDDTDHRQKHAATSRREESGAFDGLRARLVQSLGGTELGQTVDSEHPGLKERVLSFANVFLEQDRFVDVQIGFSETLKLVRTDGSVHAWDSLSGGEQSALNLAMAIEFANAMNSQMLILEEPESNLHPIIQRRIISTVRSALPRAQIFVATHSPFVFDVHLDDATLLVAKYDNGVTLANPSSNEWLFSQPSWGELSYHAYGLPTFEFHNELYGWIQDRSQGWTETAMENFLKTKGISTSKTWIRERGGTITSYSVTPMTFIRNFTHHAENTRNNAYSQEELALSIASMLRIVSDMRAGGN